MFLIKNNMTAKEKEQKYLSEINFQNLEIWSVNYLRGINLLYNNKFNLVKIKDLIFQNKKAIEIKDEKEYSRVTIKMHGKGVVLRDKELGKNIGTKKQFQISKGDFIMSKIDARNGAFGIVPDFLDGAIITNSFLSFKINKEKINIEFLVLLVSTNNFIKFIQSCSRGTTGRKNVDMELFLNSLIPLPPLSEQNKIVENYNQKIKEAEEAEKKAEKLEQDIENYLIEKLGIEKVEDKKEKSSLQFVEFKTVYEWGVDKILGELDFSSTKYDTASFAKNENLFVDIFRGKSPKYKAGTKKVILNQKCNRWNEIQLEYAKTVEEEWFEKIDKNFFTKENDILINSTGEGTIGRASNIYKQYNNLIYDSHLLLLRLNHSLVNSEYFVYLFNSSYGQKQVDKIKSAQATKQTELGVTNLKKIVFLLPPLKIQKEIVEKISAMKKEIEELKRLVEENRKKAITEFEKEIFSE